MLIFLSRDSRVDPRSLFACRMMRGQDETSTSQVGCKKGSIRESPIASSLVSSMSMEELRSLCRVPNDISLDLSEGPARPAIGQADNAVYFTREQFVVSLHFLVLSLVKQFFHVTQASPVLIHLIFFFFFQILMGCNVLNFLYQLDISMVEYVLSIC